MPDLNSGLDPEEPVDAEPAVVAPTLIALSPDLIRPNPENPRQFFPEGPLQRLADSIAEVGVLVPVTVYPDPDEDTGTTHVLLDGERRWQASKMINLPQLPVWVVGKPDGVQNALTMFNIHMLREQWSNIATTWALQKLMDETGITDDKTLREKTGLSLTQIQNMKRVLKFPPEYQNLIAQDETRFNFFVELDKALITLARRDPAAVGGRSPDDLVELFLDKFRSGAISDIIDLRKVGEIVRTSQQGNAVGARARHALENLLANPEKSVEEAYREGAASTVALHTVLRDLGELPRRLFDTIDIGLDPQQAYQLRQAVDELERELGTIREQLERLVDAGDAEL